MRAVPIRSVMTNVQRRRRPWKPRERHWHSQSYIIYQLHAFAVLPLDHILTFCPTDSYIINSSIRFYTRFTHKSPRSKWQIPALPARPSTSYRSPSHTMASPSHYPLHKMPQYPTSPMPSHPPSPSLHQIKSSSSTRNLVFKSRPSKTPPSLSPNSSPKR